MIIYKYIACADPARWSEFGSLFGSYTEARAAAEDMDGCVIELSFEYSDSELVGDFRAIQEEVQDETQDV